MLPLSTFSRLARAGTTLTLLLNAGPLVASPVDRIAAVAVFPVENLNAGSIPADDVRGFVIDKLVSAGIRVLGDADLDAFMTRHRVRYAAGIDTSTAESLVKETGVDGVVIPTFEYSSDTAPPKVALTVRLVSVKDVPSVVWASDAGLAGDEAPGLLGLGVENDYQALLTKALNRISDSLVAYVKAGEPGNGSKTASKFRPKMTYRDLKLEPGRTYSVAVMPFFNLSARRNAGEILAALFMRHLSHVEQFRILDTGVIRTQLLNARIIMDTGLSVTDADTLGALVEADFVLGGRVLRYEDYEGPAGQTRVEFSTILIDRKTRKVVWSSDSYNDGSDGVHFFERGTSKMAHAMATQMVKLTTDMIAGREH